MIVEEALRRFVEALNNLDWDRFRVWLAADCTVFFPFHEVPRRLDGREQVEQIFQSFFTSRRQGSGPPYLQIEPRDVSVQLFNETALVTLHLDETETTGRRSLLWCKRDGDWRIVHLHASDVPRSG